MDAPKLIIVGGPNGSGKTTFALNHASLTGIRYIGADAIAASISPKDPVAARIQAARQFIVDIDEGLKHRRPMIVESTLSGKSMARVLIKARDAGFQISVLLLFLDSGDTCVDRVKQRVSLGGHDVPELDIRRRFKRSIRNFWHVYRELADFWSIVYNAGSTPENVAFGDSTSCIIRIEELFELYRTIRDTDD